MSINNNEAPNNDDLDLPTPPLTPVPADEAEHNDPFRTPERRAPMLTSPPPVFRNNIVPPRMRDGYESDSSDDDFVPMVRRAPQRRQVRVPNMEFLILARRLRMQECKYEIDSYNNFKRFKDDDNDEQNNEYNRGAIRPNPKH